MVRLPLLALLAAIVLVAACESHPDVTFADDDDDDGNGGFSLLFTSPGEGEDVEFDDSIVAVFSKLLDAESFTPTSFFLAQAGTSLAASLSVEGHVARLHPSAPFEYAERYDLTIGGSVASLAGQTLSTSFTVTFRARDLRWEASHLLGPDLGFANRLGLSFAEGTGIATWEDTAPGGNHVVYASRFDSSSGWSDEILIHSTASSPVEELRPRSARNAQGDEVFAWAELFGSDWTVASTSYIDGSFVPTTGVSTFAQASNPSPRVGIDDLGNAVTVWSREPDIYAATYVAGAGWSPAEAIDTAAGDASRPDIVVFPSGEAVAVWWQYIGTTNHIWSRIYDPMTGWGTAAPIDAGTEFDGTFAPKLTLANGIASLAYATSDAGPDVQIWMNSYSGGSWGNARMVTETNDQPVSGFASTALPDGTVLVAFDKRNASLDYDVFVSECASAACAGPQLVGEGYDPVLVADQKGIARVVAVSEAEDNALVASRLIDGVWEPFSSPVSGPSATDAQMAVCEDGRVVLGWLDYASGYSVRVAELR